jgi:hypothetical protein
VHVPSGLKLILLTTYRAKKKSDVLKGDIRGLIIPTFREIRVELSGALDSARRELLTTQDQIEESGMSFYSNCYI